MYNEHTSLTSCHKQPRSLGLENIPTASLQRVKTTPFQRGARGVIIIVVGNGHDDMSSNPG